MRVLLAVHHPLDIHLGAPGASLRVGEQLERRGHVVSYFGFDHAFPRVRTFTARHSLWFPWRLAWHLARSGKRYEVVE